MRVPQEISRSRPQRSASATGVSQSAKNSADKSVSCAASGRRVLLMHRHASPTMRDRPHQLRNIGVSEDSMVATSTGAQDLHVQPYSMLMPALLDLFVHHAPDWVLGDGGSLYLTLPPPAGHVPAKCSGCSTECRRAYLVATTRDHQHARIGKQYYCASPERYERAGRWLEDHLVLTLEDVRAAVSEKIKEVLEAVPAEPPLDLSERAHLLFFRLFCTQRVSPSLAFAAIARGLRLATAEALPCEFQMGVDAFVEEQLALSAKARRAWAIAEGCVGLTRGEREIRRGGRRWRACETLLRQAAAVFSEQDRESAINGIVWELFHAHPLLKEHLSGYEFQLLAARTEFSGLGLSGWSCAFGLPVRLRSIENPFEIRAFIRRARASQHERTLPLPIWGDHTRGHQDRIEREGRPFLVVPLFAFDGDQRTDKTLGFLRVATKREGERRFTEDNQRELQTYADLLSRFVSTHLAESLRKGSLDVMEWASLFLYGAIKGQSIRDLGPTVAECFRETFDAAAASVFLRRDLWHADVAASTDDANATPVDGRQYVLWGTDAAPAHTKALETKVGHLSYKEGEGKTGWVLKHKAAVQAKYEQGGGVVVRLSRHQVLSATDGVWQDEPLAGIPAVSPDDLADLMEKFQVKASAKGDLRELPPQQHAGVVFAPLIDPDRSPEPLGVIRLIFDTWSEPDGDPLVLTVARLARSLSRQMRAPLESMRLLRTFPRLVAQATERFREEKPASEWERTMLAGGPYGAVAATLLELGEASAVSVFVHNAFAPAAYHDHASTESSWVLVGAAASPDALTMVDRDHFRRGYCDRYLSEQKGRCRYISGRGHTGKAIEARRRMYFEPEQEGDHESSDFVCEVASPVAMLVIPTSSSGMHSTAGAKGEEGAGQVDVVVRFVRTGERRRAAFLDEEQERLETVVGALRSLVPAWSEKNELAEFVRNQRREASAMFPSSMIRILEREVASAWLATKRMKNSPTAVGARQVHSPAQRRELLKECAASVPSWVLDEAPTTDAKRRRVTGVQRAEAAVLAWFLESLRAPRRRTQLTDIVQTTLRALLRVHWGPTLSQPWERKLRTLQVFEPVLSQLPRYRDHSVHQLQVFLIGWLMLRRLTLPENDNDVQDRRAVSRTWVLASVFHDIGYPLERLEQWASLFAQMATNGLAPGYRLESQAESDLTSRPTAATEMKPWLGELATAIADKTTPPTSMTREDWKVAVLECVRACERQWDHGVWAALVLLGNVDGTPDVLTAAAAIALHAGMLWKIREKNGTIDEDKALLPVLLALADSLHEWGRELRRDPPQNRTPRLERDPPAVDEVALRPRLLRILFNPSGGRAVVHIALPQPIDLAVDSKLWELESLKGVLRLRSFSLEISVSHHDPRLLAEQAKRYFTVNFDAVPATDT